MNCPNCGNENNVDFKFCIKCGQSLPGIQSAIEQQVQQSTQFQMNTVGTQQSVQIAQTKKRSKKLITLILLIVAIIVIGIFGYFSFSGNSTKKEDLNSIFNPNKPIVINENGKYGYINSEGKIIIEPKYNDAGKFYGDYAVVSIDNPNKNDYYKTVYQIIDKKGNVKLTSNTNSNPKYYSTYDVWVVDDVLYDSKFNRVLSKGITVNYIDYGYFAYSDTLKKESGIMTYKGKKVFKTSESSVYVNISGNEYNKDELYAVVSTYGDNEKEVVVSLKTGDILFKSENAEDYYISAGENGVFYYYNHKLDDGYKNGKFLFFINNKLAYQTSEVVDEVTVYDYKNQLLKIDYGDDYETLGKSKSIYYYDVKNKKMLEQISSDLELESLEDLELKLLEQNYGFKKYSSSYKYGLKSGKKIIVPCEYDDIEYLDLNVFNYMKSNGKELVLLEKDKNTILYNLKNSKPITTFKATFTYNKDISTFIRLNVYAEDYSLKSFIIYNLLSGKSMEFDKSYDESIESNYITVSKDGKKIYYNTNFKKIYETTEQ